jgi:segregation and condensation protein A
LVKDLGTFFEGRVSGNYFVKLEQFEGPLDLLLHLIRVNELDIFRIDLFVLTSQYLDYLRLLKFKDLNDAALFMEMAANLIEIKSRYLLPNEEQQLNDENVDGEDEGASLQRRLLEYDKFRRAAEYLSIIPQMGVQIQTNHEWRRLEPLFEHIEAPLRGEASTLVIMYEQLLSTLTDRKPARVTAKTERVSLAEVIEKMHEFIREARFALFQGFYPKMTARYDLVVNTLSMLQLTRDGRLNIYQEQPMGPIWIYRKDLELSDVPEVTGFDSDEDARPLSKVQGDEALPEASEMVQIVEILSIDPEIDLSQE